jgi:catechol 2,3-dioxygenase-like lactoylglutathione lyase family enzyme
MSKNLHTIGMVVNNLQESLKFYRTLGLAIPEGQDDEFHVEYENEKGISIGFIPKSTMLQTDPNWIDPTGNGRISLQFECDSANDVNSTHEKLISDGYTNFKAPWDAPWGQRFAQVLDPDGNNIAMFAQL